MTKWERQIEQDLEWREAEMASLKLLLASAPRDSDRQRALLRACCAMLYAHYEGFFKFCWTLLLDTIQAEAHPRSELSAPLAKRALVTVFKKLRGDTSDENLWQFGTSNFHTELQHLATFPEEVDTQSNLWPKLAQAINASVGIKCPLLDHHDAELGQLVGRRNKIAHGEKLEISDLGQFQRFEHAAMVVMHELAIAVVECLEQKSYLRLAKDGVMMM